VQNKNIVLLINAHHAYIRHINGEEKKYPEENALIFEAISDTYIPLLNMFAALERENVPFHVAMVFSATLCSLLSDSIIQEQYIEWLDKRIELGKKELERAGDNIKLSAAVKFCYEKANRDKIDFTEVYEQNLLRAFVAYVKKGYIELLATAGTYAFLPHWADMPEVINAQIETGLYACRHYFGIKPDGFWLPYLGYKPGIEQILRAYGFGYTILETHGILYSDITPDDGIFYPARCSNSLSVFGRDPETERDLFGIDGFSTKNSYRDQNRDIGFELTPEQLAPFISEGDIRVPTGYHYWNQATGSGAAVYEPSAAAEQIKEDAGKFLDRKAKKLDAALDLMRGKNPVLVCTVDAATIGQKWYEAIDWLGEVLRQAASRNIRITTFEEILEDQFSLQKIHPYPSANSSDGYGEDLLDSSNGWMIRYLHKAGERMIDLAERFPSDTGLKARLLNMGAKEFLLAQSGEWPKMLHDGQSVEYVKKRFRESIIAFTTVFDSLGSNTVSTEWLTNLERCHTLFPWMNYRIFSRKK
jgi:1,4-alpha-glucan branching enzyme